MKKLSLILVLAMLFALLTATSVSAASITKESESNDTSTTADTISDGAIRGSLGDADDVDYYKFEASKDYFELNFKSSSADTRDGWDVTIYNQDMVKLLSYSGVENSFSTPRMPISGTIYVKVEACLDIKLYAPVGVSYDISYTNTTDKYWESEYNETSNTANAISANKTYHGSLQSAEDVDWFKTTSADYCNITFNVNNSIDTSYDVNDGWTVSLYDSKLALLESFDVTNGKTSFNYPVTGDVYVKVKAKLSIPLYAPRHAYYDLQINSVTNSKWENEYNNESKTATSIKQGTTYIGNMQTTKDVDYYKVKTTSKAFAIKFDARVGEVEPTAVKDGWKISVYPENSLDAICSFKVDSLGEVQSITLPYKMGDTYYVKVECYSSYAALYAPIGQTYHISVVDASEGHNWEVEKRTTGVKSATTLKESATIYGNLYAKGDADYYKCKVISGGTIDVTFKREEADNDKDGYKVTVINSAGKEVASKTINDSRSGKLTKVKVSKGTYYVVVTNADYYAPGADIDYSVSFKLTMRKPTIKKVSTTKNSIKLSWDKKSDINGYRLEYATNKKFENSKVIELSKDASSYTIKNTSANKVYYVRLRALAKDGDKTYYSPWSSTSVAVNKPSTKEVKLSKNTIKVSWNKNSGASGYEVQYATNKNFENAKKIKISSKNTTSATIKKLSANKTYYVRIRTVVKGSTTYYSSWSASSVIVTSPSVKKVTPNTNTLKVSWDKNSGATSYQIQYSTNKDFSDAKRVSVSSKNSSVTIKNTSAGTTYYVRLRTVVETSSATNYSSWSSAYTVKTK